MHGKAGERDGSQGRSRVHTNPRAPGHVLFLLMTAPQSLVARKVNASNDSSSAVPWGYNQRFPDPENGLLPLLPTPKPGTPTSESWELHPNILHSCSAQLAMPPSHRKTPYHFVALCVHSGHMFLSL